MAVKFISELAYHVMCHKIGTDQEVSYRRDMVDIREFLNNQLQTSNHCKIMRSGSHREGFRLPESDIDVMFIVPRHRVIWNMSQSGLYNKNRQILILCNTSESPPGFTLLHLTNGNAHEHVASACVPINGVLFISSTKFRELKRSVVIPNSTMHGPCSSACDGGTMYDFAHCFVSDFWPAAASSWIDRCQSWPPHHVTDDIVRSGCHFVPIGHKLGNHPDNEWRISFSQAENKLVYSMNHTQFLTYGLLKLFLNEVINAGLSDEEKLLCSYHMKTAIFWAIQQNMLSQWCPENILAGFWVCFKLVLKWVFLGVCPNFFIPQNNLFLSRIYGEAQDNLFRRLYELYEKGLSLVLHISTTRQFILQGLIYRGRIDYEGCTLSSEIEFDTRFNREMESSAPLKTSNLQDCAKALLIIEHLICSSLTSNQIVSLQRLTASILRSTAFILHDKYTKPNKNKNTYTRDKKALHLLKLSARFGYVSDMLYVAMFYYKTFRYKEALYIIEISKVKMSKPCVMFKGNTQSSAYIEAVGGQSWSTKMRQAIANNICLNDSICYITELLLEQESCKMSDMLWIRISPFIVSNMLEFLTCRHNDTLRAQLALGNLKALVQHDQSDISWNILGICQQIQGDIQAALFSFRQSLRENSLCKIQHATRLRIQDIDDLAVD